LMKPPIVLNESTTITAGALDVFDSALALETYLEPWFVDEPHFIFDSDGLQLAITPTKRGVRLTPKEPRTMNPGMARHYFAAFLKGIARAKGWDFVGLTEEFVETTTLSELARASAKFATR
jgi:hypothetical protein